MTNYFEMPKLKMLVYGQPGSGKTTFVATALDDKRLAPMLYLNAFGNPEVLRKRKVLPDVIEIEEMKDFNPVYAWIEGGQDPNDQFAISNGLKPPYSTLVVDSLTEVQRFVIRAVTGGGYTPPGNLTPKLERQGFGTVLGTMLNWAVHFVKLDMNVILTSHESEKSSGPNTLSKATPLLWGQSGGELCGYVLSVVRLVTRLASSPLITKEFDDPKSYNVGHFLETQTYYAKDQYSMGIEWMEAPTLPKIMDLIEQSV